MCHWIVVIPSVLAKFLLYLYICNDVYKPMNNRRHEDVKYIFYVYLLYCILSLFNVELNY